MIKIAELTFDTETRLVLRSGKEVRPLEDPILLDAGWFVPCSFGFTDGDGEDHSEMISLEEDVTMIRGAKFEGGTR